MDTKHICAKFTLPVALFKNTIFEYAMLRIEKPNVKHAKEAEKKKINLAELGSTCITRRTTRGWFIEEFH